MAARLGNKEKFYLRPAGQVEKYNWLAAETANSLNRTLEAVETSDKSTDWAQFIGGKKGATIDATIFADNAYSAQQEILKGLYNGQKVQFFVGQLGTGQSPAPTDGEVGTAVVTAIGDTNDFGAVSTRNVSLTVDGALTHYPSLSS